MVVASEKKVPDWVARRLSLADLQAIETAVRAAESTTSAEIVPVVVRASSADGHVATLAATGYLIAVLALFNVQPLHAALAAMSAWLWAAIALFVVWFGTTDLALRLLTSDVDLDAQVRRRAELEFYHAGIGRTHGGTGILLFLSLAEHRAVVLADTGIASKLAPETWQGVVATLVTGAKQKHLGDGIAAAVAQCGALAAPHFLPVGQNPNELKDRLIIKE
jgi:putative membrane protein